MPERRAGILLHVTFSGMCERVVEGAVVGVTDEFLVCPTVFFAAKMRKIRNKPDGIHFLWFLCLFAAN